jgi:hypothetical protein
MSHWKTTSKISTMTMICAEKDLDPSETTIYLPWKEAPPMSRRTMIYAYKLIMSHGRAMATSLATHYQ